MKGVAVALTLLAATVVGCRAKGLTGPGKDAAPETGADTPSDGPADNAPDGGDAWADSPADLTNDGGADLRGDDVPPADGRDAAADVSDASDAGDARDAPVNTDARDGNGTTDARNDMTASDASADRPPDGIGGCSEARLLEQATTMMNGWTRPARVCEPTQTSIETFASGFNDDVKAEICVGNECGSAGTCAADLDWLTPFSVSRDSRGLLMARTGLHLDPRCTVRYSHGTDACLCHVDPVVLGVWQRLDWLTWLNPTSTGSSGPLTFTTGTIEITGAGRQYGSEVVTCEGTLVGIDGVDYCTLSPNTSGLARRSLAVAACDTAVKPWFDQLAATLTSYVPGYVGSCP